MCTASRKSLGTPLWVQGFLECFYVAGFKLMMSALKQPKKTTTTQILGLEVWFMSQNPHFPPKTNGRNQKKSRSWEGKSCWQTLSNLHFWSSIFIFPGCILQSQTQETANLQSEWFQGWGSTSGIFVLGSTPLKETLVPHKTCCKCPEVFAFLCGEKKRIASSQCVKKNLMKIGIWGGMKERNSFFLADAWWWAMT